MTHPNAPRGHAADNETVRTPPHNEDIEQCVLGCVYLDPRIYHEVASRLSRDDTQAVTAFYREQHRHVWRAMAAVVAEDKPIDVLTVCDKLSAQERLERVGGPSFVTRLSNRVPSAANIGTYVEILVEHRCRRELIALGGSLVDQAYDLEQDVDDIAAKAVEGVRRMRDTKRRTRMTAKQADDELERLLSGESSEAKTYSTGMPIIDQIWSGGVAGGRTYYVEALSKMGKTSVIVALTEHLMERQGFSGDFWSVEQSPVEIELRYLANLAGVNTKDVIEQVHKDGFESLPFDTQRKLTEARIEFRTWDFEIEQRGMPHIRDIELNTRARMARVEDPSKHFLVFDYVQNFTAGNRQRDRWGDLADVALRLNSLGKDLGCAVFIAAQFSKKAEDRWEQHGMRPKYSDARGLSQASNDADHLIVVHRPFVERENGRDERYMKIYQDMSRHGYHKAERVIECDVVRARLHAWKGDHPSKTRSTNDPDDSTNWREYS